MGVKYTLFTLSIFLFSLCIFSSCGKDDPEPPSLQEDKLAIIPYPNYLTEKDGEFAFTEEVNIYISGDQSELRNQADQLANQLKRSTGFSPQVLVANDVLPDGHIALELISDPGNLGYEGYKLMADSTGVLLQAVTTRGVFYGIQTLKQLFPAEIESINQQSKDWQVPAVDITDAPRFAYRGSMLDVSRHFFSVEEVKRYIDLLALYKINFLHLHLTDDQGWRIEIKSWPDLTTIGGSTEVDGGPRGFYTQADYINIVSYAAEKFITIVPEIDMPGHVNAALASYAALNTSGVARDLYTGTEVGFSALCLQKEVTYQFVNDVITEVADLTPGPYFHVGGDEAMNLSELEYIQFIDTVKQMVLAAGKRMIGWDETAKSNIDEDQVVQFWWNQGNAVAAANADVPLIISPFTLSYLNLKYSELIINPGADLNIYLETRSAYDWDPAGIIPGVVEQHVLGVEAPIWTENIRDINEVEFMAFPRIMGIAEIGWTSRSHRDWESYKTRLAAHKDRLEYLMVDYYASPLVPWK